VADLEAQGHLVQVEDRVIDLAHSDRSKTPIEPFLADQWFIRMSEIAQPALDAVSEGRIRIVPDRYAKSYLDWLGEKRDWPVSRQLWWGHRIPIWHVEGVAEDDLRRAFGTGDDVAWSPAGGGGWHVCSSREALGLESVAGRPLVRDPDTLDTWFSSALWPHSTLGWPESTAALDRFYPTTTLVTSRDIITLWVARMVIKGLFDTGKIPFHDVAIHPKILDRYGETMSKSKGNGVDPLDVIEALGADALRFGMVSMATETQDVRMPVEFQCPHCEARIEQTVQNRMLPRIACPKCGQPFRTQWARTADDVALPRGPALSERFEAGRNFSNKLWNATRFVLMNLDGFAGRDMTGWQDPAAFEALEDRWLASRLASVTREATRAIDDYRFAEAARILYAFAWDEFCSAYLELCKARLGDPATREQARSMLVLGLDTILRLLHPIMPFVTEEIWQHLRQATPDRRLPWDGGQLAEAVMVAGWPEPPAAWIDDRTERQFGSFLAVVGAIREIRSRQNVPPRTRVQAAVRCPQDTADLLLPMRGAIESMAVAEVTGLGPDAAGAAGAAAATAAGCDIFVDLAGLIDVGAEIARLAKEVEKTVGFIAAKRTKLADEKFSAKAPPAVVQKEREALAELESKLSKTEATLAALKARG
jgi:valyl-tRNA synthetase